MSGDSTEIEIKIGDYKSLSNSVQTITGEKFHYASPKETLAFMTALVDWFNQEEVKGELSPIELASLLHYRYIRIHPFEDGNGRIARLLVNYVLYRNGYPMLVVHAADKDNYLRVLHQSDINVGFYPVRWCLCYNRSNQTFCKIYGGTVATSFGSRHTSC